MIFFPRGSRKGERGMKEIDVVESWSKSAFTSIHVAEKIGGKAVDWVMQNRVFVGPEWYQMFSNIKGMKFNWLIRLWCKLNKLT
jgi:hypothetical protein